MAAKVACPAALLPLIVGRGKFAQMWTLSGALGSFDAVALDLANRGWPVADIAAALVNHPSDRVTPAEAKRVALDATAARLAAMAPDGGAGEDGLPATVVAIYEQRPRSFLVRVGDDEFEVGAADMASVSALRKACIAAIASVPDLPPAKHWQEWLREQFAAAERITQAEEASEDGNELAIIEMVLLALPIGDDIRQCMMRRRYVTDGRQYVHGPSVLLLIRDRLTITTPRFYRSMTVLGWRQGYPHHEVGKRHWWAPYTDAAPLTFDERLALAAEERSEPDPPDDRDFWEVGQ